MTRIRFGGRSVPGQHASMPGRVHGVVPANAGIANSAQSQIDLLASAASRRVAEALAIDGVQLFIFQPKRYGQKCGCDTVPDEKVAPEPSLNPNLLGMDIDSQDDISTAKGTLRVKVYDTTAEDHHFAKSKHRPDHNFSEADILGINTIQPKSSTSGTTDPYKTGSTSTGPYEGTMHDGRHAGEYDHEVADDPSDEFGEELIADYDNEAWNPESILQDNAYIIGSSQTCPICFGTGLLGGYDLLGGTRLVLSSVNATDEPLLGADNETLPPVYNLEPNEFVEWASLSCPNYFELGWAIAYNGRQDANLALTYSLDGNTWSPIGTLGSLSVTNLTTLRIRATNTSSNNTRLTHVDIALIHGGTKGQVTNFNRTAGRSAAIRGDGLEISLPQEAGRIDRNSLIGDNKHRLMWRVVTVTPVETSRGQIVSCTASTELMEPTLVETMLFPLYSVEGNKQLVYGSGVEPVQGMR